MKKYIVFTGSFNPVTVAHLHCLQTAMREIGAERGFFVPVCDEYLQKKMLKNMQRLALSADTRIAMLNAICSKHEGIEVSDYEVQSGDSVHTYKTLLHFKATYPEAEIYFLNGADKLQNIPHWNNAEELVSDIRFVLFDRADLCARELIGADPLLSHDSDHFTILPATDDFTDVSSSRIRELFLNGDEGYRSMMDSDVADILASIDLDAYPAPTMYDWIHMCLKGGPFDKVRGYKKVYELNRALFAELDLIEMLKGTVKLESLPAKNRAFSETEILCSNDDFATIIGELEHKGLKPIIISEACFSRVGGGYDGGKSDTFEEELCRVSTLAQSLYPFGNPKLKCVKESGIPLRENVYPLQIGDGFYSPNVEFVRHGAADRYREIAADERKMCDVISVASPDFTAQHKDNHIAAYMGVDNRMNEDGKRLLTDILCRAFDYAIATEHDAVIINAFGSGYHLPLADIGEVLRVVFARHNGCLKQIVVKEKKSRKYNEFYRALQGE